METGLEGTVVLVTGGAGGIGQAICRAFAADGAEVVVHYHRSEREAEKLAGEIGGIAIKADLRVPSEANDLIKNCILEMGSLDTCVANSGYYPSENKPIWEIDEKRWNSTLTSNLGISANTARSYLSHAKNCGYGSLVFVGSTAGIYGEAGHSDYAAAKGAITSGLLLSIKNEISGLGSVRVNAVAPGWTLTDKKAEIGLDDGIIAKAVSTMALKKLAKPVDVARAVVVLSSGKISGHITGQIIEVAGGMEGRIID